MLEVSLQELVFAHRSHLSLLIFLLFYYQAVVRSRRVFSILAISGSYLFPDASFVMFECLAYGLGALSLGITIM
jgi:hypothetical protein